MDKKFLTIKEASEFTGISWYVLRNAIDKGTIPAVKLANRYCINKRELMKALHMEEEHE